MKTLLPSRPAGSLPILAGICLFAAGARVQADDSFEFFDDLDLTNPEWEIIITPFGYSDLAFDKRPGFIGREYLSGEWGAAVAYARDGIEKEPTWLEPFFLFPDWETNSGSSRSRMIPRTRR